MNPSNALGDFQQTALILIPEFILLLTAVVIMTASAFVSWSRRFWCAISAGAIVAAILALLNLKDRQTALYSAVALNDDLSFYARLVLLCTGMVLLALRTASQTTSARASFSELCSWSMPVPCWWQRPTNWCSCSSGSSL